MAYQINKTDGTILATVADGQIDNLSSDITLIGKNYSGFGESINENFVKLLENFSNTSVPEHPIRGQIWFDVTESKLKVYNGNGFVPVSSATIATTQPLNLGVGDLWFNSTDKQLYFYDGTTTILLGPDYSVSQGLSGLRVSNILDSLNQNRVVTFLYNNGVLLGIFSKDAFTPKIAIDGFDGSIIPGFNAGSLSGLKFDVTVTNSDALGGAAANSYVRNDTSNIINGQLILTSNLGLIIGDANQGQFLVQTGDLTLANIASNKDITLIVRKDVNPENAIKIRSATRVVDIYEGYADSQVEIGGSAVVSGNLTVRGSLTINDGSLTTVKTTELLVEDKVIVLGETGDSSYNTDTAANRGGIILKGGDAKEFLWIYQGASTGEANDAWNSSEHINLVDKEYKIDGVTVLSKTALGATITSIPGVTSFGVQTELTVDDFYVNDNVIQVTAPNTDLELDINGTGTLKLNGSKITDLPDGSLNAYADYSNNTDAASKGYVDYSIKGQPIVLSMDISDGISNSGIAAFIEQIAPAATYRAGTIAKVLCSFLVNGTTTLNLNPLINISTSTFSTPSGTAPAVTNVTISPATVAAPGLSVSRTVKTFQIISGSWSFVP
jgi:hypothetical protein